MSEASILNDNQISTSSPSAVGSVRPSDGPSFATNDSSVTVMIVLTNNEYPIPPQLGKVDIIDDVSANIASYVVYYRKVSIETMPTI